jgi:MFS family permease
MNTTAWSGRRMLIPVICGGLIMGLALGTRHAQGLFLMPISTDHSWPREVFGFAIALQNLVWGVAQPFTGMIADRFGSAKVVGVGVLIYAIGLCLITVSGTPTEFALSAGVLIGLGLSGTAFGAIYGAISRMVPPDKTSWALGVAGAVGGLGQFVMVPGAQALIAAIGWSQTLIAIACLFALSFVGAFALQDKHARVSAVSQRQSLGAALREAFAHRGFWLLNIGFLACGFQLAFIAVHLPAYLIDKGLSAKDGVTALAIIALANVIGTYYCGYFGGLYRRTYLLAGIYFARALFMLLFVSMPLTSMSLYLFSASMGLLWLGTVPLTNGLVSKIFGLQYVSTLFGFVFLGHQLGGFLGVWFGAYVFDHTGSYNIVWIIGIGLGVIASLLHWPINDATIERPRQPRALT